LKKTEKYLSLSLLSLYRKKTVKLAGKCRLLPNDKD